MKEFAALDLGDERLNRRGRKVATERAAAPGWTDTAANPDPAACRGAYRFINHERVTTAALLAAHRPACVARCASAAEILLASDTTALSFNDREQTTGLGPLSSTGSRGIIAHPTYAVTPGREPLGVLDVRYFVRDEEDYGQRRRTDRRHLPVEKRESRKWLSTLEAAEGLRREIGPKPQITCVADREGDLAEVLSAADARRDVYRVLVRARVNRVLRDAAHGRKALDRIFAQPVAGTYAVQVPAAPGRPARTAQMDVRFGDAELAPTRLRHERGKRQHTAAATVAAVIAVERDPPAGVKEPLDWRLYTTRDVRSVADAVRCVELYAGRWSIEILFRAWKDVMRAEARQYRDGDALQASLTLDLLLAFTFLQMAHLHRAHPDAPATEVFAWDECRALWKFRYGRACARAPTLAEMSAAVAELGGYGKGARYQPGARTFARGMQKLTVIVEVWSLLRK